MSGHRPGPVFRQTVRAMKRSLGIIFAVLAMCGAYGTDAVAQRGPPTLKQFFGNFDTDGDGRVSRKEFPGPPRRFKRMDADNDGFATKKEFKTYASPAPPDRCRSHASAASR